MIIQILDSAKQDLIDGYFFYEKQSYYLGNYFLDSLYSDIDSLLIYTGIQEIHFGYYRALSTKFPFAIYYNIIKVYAILDCRKRPAWIRKKLKNKRS
jgi:hypothetical protein